MKPVVVTLSLLALGLPSVASADRPGQMLPPESFRVVDLTHTLDEDTPMLEFPPPLVNQPRLSREELTFFDERGPFWAGYALHFGEHTGTHLDAPCHWISGHRAGNDCVHEIPAEKLVGPAVVIDIRDRVAADPGYIATVEDVIDWERAHGRIPARAWVLFQTGWSSRHTDEAAYINNGAWPGPSAELIQFLVYARDIQGLGTESVGVDAGGADRMDPPFPVHHFLARENRYGISSMTNLDQLPPRGALLIVAPMKLRDGTGAPARVMALTRRAPPRRR